MKKLRGIMAILAATALIFGTVACSDGGGNDNNNNKTPTDQSDPISGGSGTSDPVTGGGGSEGGSSLEAIADSWNFVSQADSVAWVSAVKSAADTTKADGTATLTSNVDILGADGKLTLSLLEGSAAAFKYSTALGTTGNSAASFSYVDPAYGLRIKGTAIKIAGVQGKAKITVSWIGVKDNRAIGIFEGAVDDSTPLIKKETDTSKPTVSVTGNSGPMTGYIQDDLVLAVNYTSEAKDLYLVAGNNVYIKSIAIEDAADVTENTISVFIPNFDDGSLEETGKTVSIGYADSISSSDLITVLKADTSLADTFAQVLTVVQAEVNEDLVAGGAESGAVTVTADLIDYWFFAKADWSKIIDEDESNDPTPVTTIAAADEVVVAFTRSDSLDSKVEAAIAAASGTVVESNIYVLSGESGKFSLGKTNVGMIGETANAGGSEYLSVASDNWSGENTIGDYTDAFYNLSGATRNITAKVKGVAAFTLYVKNSNANRTFTVKIGDGAAETINHPGKQTINGTETDIIPFTFNTGSTDELSIVIGGGSASVYPGYIVAYSAAQTIPVETVEITGAPTAAVLIADGSVQLGATVAPARATEQTLTWTSDATDVATVDSTGNVTFVGAGSATITATAPSGGKAEVTIVVQAAVVNVTGIVVKDSSDATSGTVNAGDTITLTATVSPDDASNKAVTWTSSNEDAATVVDGVVTAVGAGTATITATAADGSGVSGSYAVTVNAVTTATYFVFESGAAYSGAATVVGDYFTAGTATWGNAEGFGITASSVTVGKNSASVYGAYFTGDMSYTAETDGLWVTIPITTTEAVELANVTGEFRNNKTDNVQVVIYVDNTKVETVASSSKVASLKLSNPVSLSAGDHTVKIAVQGKTGKTETKTGAKLEFNSIVISVGK